MLRLNWIAWLIAASACFCPRAAIAAAPNYAVDARDYGAVGDGITNNTAAFTQIFAALDSPTVWFPAGTYLLNCGTFTAASNLSLLGDAGAIIKLSPGCSLTGNLFTWQTKSQISIKNITIDVNNATSAVLKNVLLFRGTSGFDISDVSVINALDPVILIGVSSFGQNIKNFSIRNNFLSLSSGSTNNNQCILLSLSGGGNITGGKIDNNVCEKTGMTISGSAIAVTSNDISSWAFGAGIYVTADDTANIRDITISGNHIHDGATSIDSNNTPSHGIETHGANVLVANNIIWNNGGNGVSIMGPHTKVVGNLAYNNGRRSDGIGGSGFTSLYANSNNNGNNSSIVGNTAYDDDAGTQKYGYAEFEVASGLSGITLRQNNFSGAAQDLLLIAGAGTVSDRSAISKQTASNSATLDWLALDSASYKSFNLECTGLVPSTAARMQILVGQGSGPAWQTTNYQYAWLINSTGAFAPTGVGSASDSAFNITNDNLQAGGSAILKIYFDNLSTNIKKMIRAESAYQIAGGSLRNATGMGSYWGNTNPITAIRLKMSSGNIASGQCTLFGQP